VTAYNLLSNSSFEDGWTWWNRNDDDYTLTLVPSGGWDGGRYVNAAVDTSPGVDSGAVLESNARTPAAPGDVLTVSLYMRGVGATVGRTFTYQISFWNAAGSQISGSASGSAVLGSSWTRYTRTGTAPAGTVRISVAVFSTVSGTVADAFHMGGVMVNRGGAAAPYTAATGPNTWAGNANYDLSKLTFMVATPGFILGEGVIGEDTLGTDSFYGTIPADFTSLVVNEPSTVEDGLFVRREVSTATLTSTRPELMAHKGKRLYVEYGTGTPYAKAVFWGTINDVSMTESVDTNAHLPGNTATRTHRVTLTASSSTEYFATQNAPAQDFDTGNSLQSRAQKYLSLGNLGSFSGADPDVDSSVMTNILPTGALPRTTIDDDPDTLLNTLWKASRIYGVYWRLFPWSNRIDFESISRPASGGTTVDSALRFTDDPELVTGIAPAELHRRTHTDRTVSYTERAVGMDSSLWCTSVTVKAHDWATEVEETVGPFSTPGTARRQDVELDLGAVGVGETGVVQLARNVVSTLPLKAKPEPFTRSLRAPMQSTAQVQGRVPGLATLNVDGADQQIAILATTHTITPDRWMVDYEVGPPHLLTRESDYDPSPPRNLTVTQPGGTGTAVTIAWDTPRVLPRDVPLYKQVRHIRPALSFSRGMVPADTDWVVVSNEAVPATEQPGDLQSVTVPVSALDNVGIGTGQFLVQYTQDPSPGSGTFNPAFRLGQPARVENAIS
jgi:hypothetical protein